MANLPKMPNLNDLKNLADSSGLLHKAKAMFDSITNSIGGVPTPLSEEALADPLRAKLYECELLLQQIKDGQIAHIKLINNLDTALTQLSKIITTPKPSVTEEEAATPKAESVSNTTLIRESTEDKVFSPPNQQEEKTEINIESPIKKEDNF